MISVSDRASSSCYRLPIQSHKVSVAVLKLNFGFPNLGEWGPLWGWTFVVLDRASVTSYRSHYKALRCPLWFCCHV